MAFVQAACQSWCGAWHGGQAVGRVELDRVEVACGMRPGSDYHSTEDSRVELRRGEAAGQEDVILTQ